MDNELYKIFEKTYFNHKYYLKEFKGAGAFGAVFLAGEVVGGTKIQEVAIKAIRKDKMPSDIIAKELVTAIRLKHPNLINCITSEEGRLKHSVFDYDCFGLVMEIASGTLEDYLQASRVLPVSEVREIVEAIASGLVYLHGQSVTHRDLKPANVLRVGNVWKISDFGIARQMGRESGTMTTSLTGTPIYMPPEVYAAYSEDAPMKVSPAWDIWSLGVMIVEMLTGELPFDGVTDIWKMKIKIKAYLPTPFDEIVQNCLREYPNERFNAKQILDKNLEVKVENITKFIYREINFAHGRGDALLGEGYDAYGMGDTLHGKNYFKEAIDAYSRMVYFKPDNVDAYNIRGITKYELEDKQGAIADFSKAIRFKPDFAIAFSNRGIAKYELGDKQGAMSDFTEAICLKPDFANAFYGRGIVKYELGDKQSAINDFKQFVCLRPELSNDKFKQEIAKCNLEYKQWELTEFRFTILLEPDFSSYSIFYNSIYYNWRGDLKYNLENHQEAIYDFNKAIHLFPHSYYSLCGRGLAKFKLGDKQGAINDFNEAIRIDPNKSQAYENRGQVKSKLGNKQGALIDFNEAIRIDPKDADSYYNRALIKKDAGNKKEALVDFRKASRLYKYKVNFFKQQRYIVGVNATRERIRELE
ncbi:protein kinase domain-containing protein [Pseudanabaena minima]|uniref:protein kinase domain-containing protein n=1 Tax=Pseudanabaena minima TaxID=890415 RepID=UPI003DA7D5FA